MLHQGSGIFEGATPAEQQRIPRQMHHKAFKRMTGSTRCVCGKTISGNKHLCCGCAEEAEHILGRPATKADLE